MSSRAEPQQIIHPFPPFVREDARILILGSFPSVKSREQKFFYGHPQNRFWKVMAGVCGCPVPGTIDEKKAFLAQNHIALWDTIHSCTILGSSDSSIRDVVPNDLTPILDKADIREIYCNGGTSYRLYEKYLRQQTGREAVKMPSTSPANAAWSVDRLMQAWSVIAEKLQDR
ncbi:MAG: DNA-deoxyinosine glycosylase [Lachnospiraceae bacterium]|nr:DNA-deoxyinosine glycosylase [Lachnospiraceae bacterium]